MLSSTRLRTTFLWPAWVVLAALGLSGCLSNAPETVDRVDLERYQGLWYEIASYPTFFNRGLAGTTAEYTLQEDGTVRVVNRAFEESLDGEPTEIVARARVVDEETMARLTVSFDGVPAFPTFGLGNYWVIGLDDDGYTWAVVSGPLRSTLFILSRTPQLEPATLDAILADLEARDFDLDRLTFTPQPENP